MKKRLSVLFVSLLCALSLTLMACGGGDQNANTDGKTDDTTQTETKKKEKKDPKEQFVGEWKLAVYAYEGVSITGDFSAMMGEDAEGIALSLKDDGTGSMTVVDGAYEFTWELKDDTTATFEFSPDNEDIENKGPFTIEATDGVLQVKMDDGSYENVTLIFSADGTAEGYDVIKASDATEIKSEKDLVGTWKFSGMSMEGTTVYGDGATVGDIVGFDEEDVELTINKDGTATFMGEEMTWSVDKDGAKIGTEDEMLPVKAYKDGILIDMSEYYGSDMCMIFKK